MATAGDELTRWTVRVALALYVAALALRCGPAARGVWAAGCGAFLLHAACAFHFAHGWSHAAAYESTARRSAAEAGFDSGVGLYANYAFALVWGLDAVWWWLRPEGYAARSRGLGFAVQGFLGFMAFQGAVVFAAGPTRYVGLAACVLLVAVWWRNRADEPTR